jgi:hypothetical protein
MIGHKAGEHHNLHPSGVITRSRGSQIRGKIGFAKVGGVKFAFFWCNLAQTLTFTICSLCKLTNRHNNSYVK